SYMLDSVDYQHPSNTHFSPILYQKEYFDLLHYEYSTFPAPQPFDPGVEDIQMSIGVFLHRESSETYRVVNVRLPEYQNYNVDLAIRQIRGILSLSSSTHNILMGNINIEPDEPIFDPFKEGSVLNAWEMSARICNPNYNTYVEMDPASKVKEIRDYIFTDHPDVFWICVDEKIVDGYFPSSHLPVYMIIRR
ncbi:MAG: hypothetical protein HRT74_13200, partial [Flavobacteriales bacterium]|nr:hypothetical protein [Flavobacteriales bacterium]